MRFFNSNWICLAKYKLTISNSKHFVFRCSHFRQCFNTVCATAKGEKVLVLLMLSLYTYSESNLSLSVE